MSHQRTVNEMNRPCIWLSSVIRPKTRDFLLQRSFVFSSRTQNGQVGSRTHRSMSSNGDKPSSIEESVEAYYTQGDLWQRISQALDALGYNNSPNRPLHPDDLAPLDEFHSRGRQGTIELCELIKETSHCLDSSSTSSPSSSSSSSPLILDVGCGLGGTARYLASVYGVHVTGIDLVHEYVVVGNELTRRVGGRRLAQQVTLQQASALHLPFGAATFDLVYTVHVQMNISDKVTFYQEMARVVKTGGHVVFHDVFLGETASAEDVRYPCPWAESQELSHLVTPSEMKELVRRRIPDLNVTAWHDMTNETIASLERAVTQMTRRRRRPEQQQDISNGISRRLGLHLVLGQTAVATKLKNHLHNCQTGRTVVGMGILTKM